MANYDAYDPYDGATQFQPSQQPGNPPAEEEAPDKSLNSDQKKAVVAAGVGTAALGGAAYALSKLEDGDNLADNDGENDGSGQQVDPNANLVAHVSPQPPVTPTPPVDPFAGLTGFDKAFHEARMAYGAGHTFQYEGGTYNTYTKEEEANLTPEERSSFLAANNLVPAGHSHHQAAGTALASTDPDDYPSVSIDTDPVDHHHGHVAGSEPSVSLIDDDSAVVTVDSDHTEHVTEPVATLDDHLLDDHHDLSNGFSDPAHDFDNHADVSDFT